MLLHAQGPPYRSALRKLAEKFLHRQIQAGSHDSIDDARAAMELTLLKIKCAPRRACFCSCNKTSTAATVSCMHTHNAAGGCCGGSDAAFYAPHATAVSNPNCCTSVLPRALPGPLDTHARVEHACLMMCVKHQICHAQAWPHVRPGGRAGAGRGRALRGAQRCRPPLLPGGPPRRPGPPCHRLVQYGHCMLDFAGLHSAHQVQDICMYTSPVCAGGMLLKAHAPQCACLPAHARSTSFLAARAWERLWSTLSLHATLVACAGNASAFVCQDDEACCAAATKEGANKATNFVWVQLRDLGSFLEQRSWHRSPSTIATPQSFVDLMIDERTQHRSEPMF